MPGEKTKYDALKEPEGWLEIDEGERILLVLKYHETCLSGLLATMYELRCSDEPEQFLLLPGATSRPFRNLFS